MSTWTEKEEQLDELRAKKHALKNLMESDGWKLLIDLYQGTKMGRRNTIFGMDAKGMDDLIQMGQVKSELAGMDFIINAPTFIYDETDLEEHGLLLEMEDDNQQIDD